MRATRLYFWTAAVLFLVAIDRAAAESDEIKALLRQADYYERAAEWDKACDAYEMLLRLERGSPEIRARYVHCLRRFWQARRHRDLSYRKEVLELEQGQALRLYTIIRDTLLDQSVDRKKVDAGKLFGKGLEEFDAALADPSFCAQYLPDVKAADLQAFRTLLLKTWGGPKRLARSEAVRQLRDVAWTAQRHLNLDAAVCIMEFACGACYALDDYTVYLTPTQLSELCQSLKGEFLPSVSYHMKSANVGYVQISGMHETTVQEVDNALAALAQLGMKGLVLDLRGNGGGLFEAAIDVARRFLTSGVIASTRHHDAKLDAVYQARNPMALTLPLVVLIDADTASAAEVLAGALKENQRARLIGQTTFGKGCTQCVLKLPSATGGVPTGGLRLTVARFYSPRGEPYSDRGVVPDMFVGKAGEPMAAGLDQPLQAALIELERQFTAPR